MVAEKQSKFKWGMAVDIDKCNGCQACVIACQSENNIPINTEDNFKDARGIEWIRVETASWCAMCRTNSISCILVQ